MTVRTLVVAVLSAAALLGSSPSSAAEKPSDDLPVHVDVTLRDVRYQVLPDEVGDVRMGPDGRPWFLLRGWRWPYDPTWSRRQIEREFSRPAPQLLADKPVLFEPGGRIWFVCGGDDVLLGYDGHTWIEKDIEKKYYRGKTALWVAGCAMFPTDTGMICFDGDAWTYQALYPPGFFRGRGVRTDLLHLFPQADGKTVLVAAEEFGLWRWQEGNWSQVPLPPGCEKLKIATPWCGGLLLVPEKGPVSVVYEGTDLPPEFADLVTRLGGADYKIREAATQEFVDLGPWALGPARQALSGSNDAEVRGRLKTIIGKLEGQEEDKDGALVIGRYRFENPQFTEQPDVAANLVWARNIVEDGKALGPGMGLLMPGGKVRVFPGGLADPRSQAPVGRAAAMSDKSVWCYFETWLSDPVRLLDVREGKFVAEAPSPSDGLPLAALRDGTLLFRVSKGTNLAAFKASAPDDRRYLDAAADVPAEPLYKKCLAPDGTLWVVFEAPDPEGRIHGPTRVLHHFDGKRWEKFEQKEPVYGMVFGQGGAMLITFYESVALVAGGKATEEKDLQTLIERYPREFAAAFPPTGVTGSYEGRGGTWVTDKAGNIWLRENKSLKVRVGDRWLDATGPLVKAGADPSSLPGHIAAVGDASKVVACDPQQQAVYFLQVKDGVVAVEKPPAGADAQDYWLGLLGSLTALRDTSGALWFVGCKGRKHSIEMIGPGNLAIRATEAGLDAPIEGVGCPWLTDMGGNVWLAARKHPDQAGGWSDSACKLNVWRDGRVGSTVSVPGTWWEHGSWLASDRAGSVWAWTSSGFYHLTAENPAEPAHFSAKSCYYLRGIHGSPSWGHVSPLGFLEIESTAATNNAKSPSGWFLNIVPLPKD